jgi:hypothetical protein
MEVLAGFSDEHKRDLVRHFLHGYAPGGMESSELEELRLWTVHGSLGWAMLHPPTEEEIRLATNSMHLCNSSDDPAGWF